MSQRHARWYAIIQAHLKVLEHAGRLGAELLLLVAVPLLHLLQPLHDGQGDGVRQPLLLIRHLRT